MKVGVVMPARNAGAFVEEAVRSILDQTLRDLELVVVDDGSTDDTATVLSRIEDERLRVLRTDAGGLTNALNTGWRATSAPYIARMDADDVALAERLERQLAFFDAHPEVALVGGGYIVIDEAGREIGRVRYPARPGTELLRRNCFAHPTVVMRRTVLEELGGYRFDQNEDYDLWLRIAERYDVANVREPVLRYRHHPGQFSVDALERQAAGRLAVRVAARARRRGEDDPLSGVDHLDVSVLQSLGVAREELERTVRADAIWWAGTLAEDGDEAAADALLARAGAKRGVGFRISRAKAALRSGRPLRATRALLG